VKNEQVISERYIEERKNDKNNRTLTMEMNRIWHTSKSWIVRLIKLVTGVALRSFGENFTILVSQVKKNVILQRKNLVRKILSSVRAMEENSPSNL